MKKILCMFLSALLLLSAMPFSVAENSVTLPQPGNQCSGFTVRDISRLDMLNADVVLYEHEKTGALVMLIENEDTNRTFEITFRTPVPDNTGIPHIFEHSTLSGSKKYPSKNLFFNMKYQTYNTFMNAATYGNMTTYPCASLSEKQLLSLTDYYTDACFNPMIYEDESIFREEAWRYVLDSADDDLTLEGTVYSEMRGAYTIDFAAYLNYRRTLFPGSVAGNNYGGTPAEIPNLTWDKLKAYHDVYYHPSNSLTCLYGKIEHPEDFLALLDGYFSAYEKKEFVFEDADYTPIPGSVESVWEYGISSGSNTENGSVIYYAFACEGCDEKTCFKLDMLSTLLNRNSSLLMQKLNKALPYASVSCSVDASVPVPAIVFTARNVNPEDVEIFRRTVDEAMTETLETGFDPEAVSAVASATEISSLLIGESASVGVDLIPSIASLWVTFDDPHGYQEDVEMKNRYVQFAEDGTFAQLIREFLVENDRHAISVTKPVAGLKEEEDAALAQKLAEIKAGMSDAEIAEIVAAPGQTEEDNSALYLQQLKSVPVAELPEELRIYEMTDETGEDSIRRIFAAANTDGIGEAMILLDAGGFTQEELLTFKLYTTLLGKLDTEQHTRAQISSLITRYLYNASLRFSVMETPDGKPAPYLRGSFIAMDEDMQAGYDLLYELFFETKFDDEKTVLGEISSQKNELKQSINNDPRSMLYYRGYGNVSQSAACFAYVSFMEYYDFLCETEKRMETEPEVVLEELSAVQRTVNTRRNAVSAFVGNIESEKKHRIIAETFLDRLKDVSAEHQEYDFALSEKTEAFITESPVQFNVRFASYEAMGLDSYRGELGVLNSMMTDAYLLPKLRDQYGAYGANASANRQYGEVLYTYRDPYISETAEVFDTVPENVAGILDAVDQDTLDGYILSNYSSFALSQGELSGGLNAVINMLCGMEQTDVLDYMKQLKSLTTDALGAYTQMLEKLTQEGSFFTAGSAEEIHKNAERYDVIYDCFTSRE